MEESSKSNKIKNPKSLEKSCFDQIINDLEDDSIEFSDLKVLNQTLFGDIIVSCISRFLLNLYGCCNSAFPFVDNGEWSFRFQRHDNGIDFVMNLEYDEKIDHYFYCGCEDYSNCLSDIKIVLTFRDGKYEFRKTQTEHKFSRYQCPNTHQWEPDQADSKEWLLIKDFAKFLYIQLEPMHNYIPPSPSSKMKLKKELKAKRKLRKKLKRKLTKKLGRKLTKSEGKSFHDEFLKTSANLKPLENTLVSEKDDSKITKTEVEKRDDWEDDPNDISISIFKNWIENHFYQSLSL